MNKELKIVKFKDGYFGVREGEDSFHNLNINNNIMYHNCPEAYLEYRGTFEEAEEKYEHIIKCSDLGEEIDIDYYKRDEVKIENIKMKIRPTIFSKKFWELLFKGSK